MNGVKNENLGTYDERKHHQEEETESGIAKSLKSEEGSAVAAKMGCRELIDLEIVDLKRENVVVNGTTQIKIVGQRIELGVRTDPPGKAMRDIQWIIPGQTVKCYEQTKSSTTKIELHAGDCQSADVAFYWIVSERLTVEVKATIQEIRKSVTVIIDILAPTDIVLKSETGVIAVEYSNFAGSEGDLELHYGKAGAFGISWALQATAPNGGSGEIVGIQLLNTNGKTVLNDDTVVVLSSKGKFILDVLDTDNFVFYDFPVAIQGGKAATWKSNDSPSSLLTSDVREIFIDDRFRLYFMYKPVGDDSIWVALGRLDWDWSAKATCIKIPDSDEYIWNPATDVYNTKNPSGKITAELPEWDQNFPELKPE